MFWKRKKFSDLFYVTVIDGTNYFQTIGHCNVILLTLYPADLLPYKGGEGLTHKFLEEILKINLEYIDDSFDRSSRVLEFHHPHDLKEKLHLEIPEKPENLDQILDDCRKTLQYCVKTGKWYNKNGI